MVKPIVTDLNKHLSFYHYHYHLSLNISQLFYINCFGKFLFKKKTSEPPLQETSVVTKATVIAAGSVIVIVFVAAFILYRLYQ